MDLNTEAPNSGTTPPPVSTPSDSSTPRERLSVRESIRQSFDQHRDTDERQERDRETEVKDRSPETEEDEDHLQDARASDSDKDSDSERDTSSASEEEADEAPEQKANEAPSAWTKEAKETWKDLPERTRAEIEKREKDMEKGVRAIKDKYKEIDDAFEPYRDTIARFQKTPGQAIHQLFGWFNALAENPDEAFPALINSYKMDPRRIVEKYWPGALQRYARMEEYIKSLPQNQQPQNQQQANGQAQQQEQPQVHPQVAQYIQQLEQKLTGLEQAVGQRFTAQDQYYEQQNAARTSEFLDHWSKDKPHFERVRTKMGYLLTPDPNTGQAAVPLKDGKVDLDTAYEQAVWMDQDIRNELLEQQRLERIAKAKAAREAKEKASQEAADRARRASGSLTSSAPGSEVGRKTIPSKGLSVRDSLKQAIAEVAGR